MILIPQTQYVRVALITALGIVLCSSSTYGQDKTPEVFVASTSEYAGGNTEAEMNQDLLQLLEKHVVEGVTRKATAAFSAQGVTAKFPPFQSSSTYITIGGKKLAVIKLRNDYASQVLIHGIVGKEFRRVACVKTRGFKTDVPVFYGMCGDAVRATFELKGIPGALKINGKNGNFSAY